MPFMVMKKPKGWSPEAAIWEALGCKPGELPVGFEVFGNRVLVATYIPPDQTAGGVFLSDQTKDEQKNQGKACMVVGIGPNAFKSDQYYDFAEQSVAVGDWICLWVYEARPLLINKVACRMLKDTDVQMKIPRPDYIF